MSTLRSLRLLGAVEAGTVTGAQLETYLADVGRRSELSALLSNRGQSRRMAGSPLTMTAITASPQAINIVFTAATALTSAACTAVVASPSAMTSVTSSITSLNAVGANSVAWGLFSTSAYYETNVKSTLALYAGLNPTSYASVAAFVLDPVAMADIAISTYGVQAVIASSPTMTLVANNSSAMGQMAGNAPAITYLANSSTAMSTIAANPLATTEINSRSTAVGVVSNSAIAIQAIAGNAAGWTAFQAGSYFATNVPAIVANLVGVSTTTYPTLASMIDNAATMAKIAASTPALTAMASNSAAMTYLANSANLPATLANSSAMAILGPNTSAMNAFLGVSGAWAPLFTSSVAKGYIIASTTLVNTVAANSALVTYLTTNYAVTNVTATGVPDGNATSLQSFVAVPALPAKLLTLSAKETGIAATYSNYNFGGTPMTGSQAGATLSLSGTGPGGQPAHIAGYTNMTWNFQGVGVTAATLPIITYVSMV